jgi:hypothetical protein
MPVAAGQNLVLSAWSVIRYVVRSRRGGCAWTCVASDAVAVGGAYSGQLGLSCIAYQYCADHSVCDLY